MTDEDIVRFWKYVDKNGPVPMHIPEIGQCWVWLRKGRVSIGYGNFSEGRNVILAHRYSWMVHNGEIPKGQCVLHKCDNPICVNPDHLWLGSYLDNQRDSKAKGRHRSPITENPAIAARGEKVHGAKLNAERVAMIKQLCKKRGDISIMAKWFGVSIATVYLIVSGKSWKHIT